MFVKSFNIICDFFKSIKKGEFFESTILPLIFIILLYIFDCKITIDNISSINDSILTIAALLIAFSVCSVTLLFSISNANITRAKATILDRVNFANEKISYFQLIQIRSYYNVIIQFVLIISCIFYKIMSSYINIRFLFYINLYLIVHSLSVLCLVIIHMYHLSWQNDEE